MTATRSVTRPVGPGEGQNVPPGVVLLRCERMGRWTVSTGRAPLARFSDFATALDCARRIPTTEPGTIEVWQGRNYICCLTRDCLPGDCSDGDEESSGAGFRARSAPRARGALAVAERYGDRAQIAVDIGGPLLWLALVVLAVAGAFGWKLSAFGIL